MKFIKPLFIAIFAIISSSFATGQTVCSNVPNFMDLNSSCVVCNYGNTWNLFSSYTGIVNNRHTLIRTQGFDPNTGNKLPFIPEGDTTSIRLGNSYIFAEADAVTYHFNVQEDTALLMIKFAVVLQDPAHSFREQPRFVIRILDASDQLLESCMEYDVTAQAGIPGFETYTGSWAPIRWRPWTTLALDLSPYAGQDIKVQFITYDCSAGAHFGYAYFTAKCFPSKFNVTACRQVGDTIRLSAPSFCESYLWTNGDTTSSTSYVIQDGVPLAFSCLIKSFTGCEVTLNAQLSDIPTIRDTTIFDTICEGEPYIKNDFDLPPQFITGTHYYIKSIYNALNCEETINTFLYLTVIPRLHYIDDFICKGQDYVQHGFTILNPLPGMIRDTQFIPLARGCDSMVFLTLTVSPFTTSLPEFLTGELSPCTGSVETYSLSNAEHFVNFEWTIPNDVNVIGAQHRATISLQFTDEAIADTLKLYASNGCIGGWVSLFIKPKISHYLSFSDSICEGLPYNKNDFNIPRQDSAGLWVYTQILSSHNGCDSVRALYLYVFPKPEVEIFTSADVICKDNPVELHVVGNLENVRFSITGTKIGDILCTDESVETPANFPSSGKTAQGIIFYIDPDRTSCWVVGLHVDSTTWGISSTIPGVGNVVSTNWSFDDFDTAGYQNTFLIRQAGSATDFPAAWTVDLDDGWFLPAATQLRVLYTHIPLINESFIVASGAPFPTHLNGMGKEWTLWSSTQAPNPYSGYSIELLCSGMLQLSKRTDINLIRPIRYFRLTE